MSSQSSSVDLDGQFDSLNLQSDQSTTNSISSNNSNNKNSNGSNNANNSITSSAIESSTTTTISAEPTKPSENSKRNRKKNKDSAAAAAAAAAAAQAIAAKEAVVINQQPTKQTNTITSATKTTSIPSTATTTSSSSTTSSTSSSLTKNNDDVKTESVSEQNQANDLLNMDENGFLNEDILEQQQKQFAQYEQKVNRMQENADEEEGFVPLPAGEQHHQQHPQNSYDYKESILLINEFEKMQVSSPEEFCQHLGFDLSDNGKNR